MRKFACAYAQGLPGAREFRGRVSRVVTEEEFLAAVRETFPRERVGSPEPAQAMPGQRACTSLPA
jgi:hypothetical protein